MGKPVFQGWFSFSGRRNRQSYLLFNLSLVVIVLAWIAVLAVGFDDARDDVLTLVLACVLLLVPVVLCFCHAVVSAQRFRDFGWTGWAILLFLIPVVGVIAAIVLLVMPGTQGANRYGEDPLRF